MSNHKNDPKRAERTELLKRGIVPEGMDPEAAQKAILFYQDETTKKARKEEKEKSKYPEWNRLAGMGIETDDMPQHLKVYAKRVVREREEKAQREKERAEFERVRAIEIAQMTSAYKEYMKGRVKENYNSSWIEGFGYIEGLRIESHQVSFNLQYEGKLPTFTKLSQLAYRLGTDDITVETKHPHCNCCDYCSTYTVTLHVVLDRSLFGL